MVIFWNHISTQNRSSGTTRKEHDEDSLCSAHTSSEVTGVDDDVDKCTAELIKEAHNK